MQSTDANANRATKDDVTRVGQVTARDPEKSASHNGTPSWAVWWIALLLIAFAGVTLTTPTGWLGSDDAGYYAAAEYVTSGTTITRTHHHYARLAMSLPIALSITLFGDHVWAIILPTYLASLGVLGLVVAIGRLLWGWREGLIAASLLLAIPYVTTLSTAAYPDMVACFWSAAGFLLALHASRLKESRRRAVWAIGSGLAIAAALSTKVLIIPVLVGIAYAVWFDLNQPRRARLACLGYVGLGLSIGLLIESAIFAAVAHDPLFRWHALLTTQSNTVSAGGESAIPTLSIRLMIDRLALPFRTGVSGWGLIGMMFWPVMIAAGVCVRRARALVVWAVASYLAVAFGPINFDGGWHVFPYFHGRHILPCVIPLVLCTASLCRYAIERLSTQPMIAIRWACAWPLVIVLAGVLHLVSRGDISGFANRDMRRIGRSIEKMVANDVFEEPRPIFMTPSTYWRYRLLFPPTLRERLRVTTEPDAPAWWTDTCIEITELSQPLPPPNRAYLLATPRQLNETNEFWDYGVNLPHASLAAWRDTDPIAAAFRLPGGNVALKNAQATGEPLLIARTEPVLILSGIETSESDLFSRLSQGAPNTRRLSE